MYIAVANEMILMPFENDHTSWMPSPTTTLTIMTASVFNYPGKFDGVSRLSANQDVSLLFGSDLWRRH
jgi:hypothetical protein